MLMLLKLIPTTPSLRVSSFEQPRTEKGSQLLNSKIKKRTKGVSGRVFHSHCDFLLQGTGGTRVFHPTDVPIRLTETFSLDLNSMWMYVYVYL